MKKKFNVGLIGTGRLGNMYAEFLKTRVSKANLVAVADIIPERAKKCAEKFEVEKTYFSHQEINDDKSLDAVIVTATTGNHKEIVIDAAEKKQTIFCEKPMTLSLNDAREMKSVVERNGVFYQQGYMRRFDKGFAAAKKKIDEGVIGRPVVFRGSSRDPYLPSLEYLYPKNSGGQILDMAIHDFDIARWYMGDIATIYSIGGVLAFPEVEETGDTDNVVMALKFESGTLGEVDISRNGVYGYDIRAEVLGTKGTLQVGYLRDTPMLVLTKEGVTHDVVPYFPERFCEAYVSQLDDFLQNIETGSTPMITINDGIAGLQVAVAATDSLIKGTVVKTKDY
ncbi:myo-inositol 2-dehydrogenase 1 [hydrocarbon metagenome]|uniref:Myo-inositol 2-dehydrogenase 1 n=1 Tax=hydrocarbon metagenome TaxID=938273 RepID=A0A0W8G0D9_9ZZZZ